VTLSELLVYGLIVAAVIIFNYIIEQGARKSRKEAERRAEAPAPSGADYRWGRHPTAAVPASPEAATHSERGMHSGSAIVTSVAPLGAVRPGSEPAFSLEELRAREAPALIEGQRPRPVHRHREARRLLATRAALRRAVIAMTVLGPCRAIEPWDPQPEDRTRARSS